MLKFFMLKACLSFLSAYRLSGRHLLAMILLAGFSLTHSTASASDAGSSVSATQASSSKAQSTQFLDVYKSPTCGCCQEWIDHMEAQGFSTDIHHPTALN